MNTRMTTSKTERIVREVMASCYAGLSMAALWERVLAALHPSVGWDRHCLVEFDPASRLIVGADSHTGDLTTMRRYFADVYFDQDAELFARLIHDGRRVILPSGRDAPSFSARRAFLSAHGIRQDLIALAAVSGEPWGGLVLFRDSHAREFAPETISLLRRLAPHLGAGFRSATLRSAAEASPFAETGPAVLVLDRHGNTVQRTAAAQQYLGELGAFDGDGQMGKNLPAAVWLAIGAVRRVMAGPPSDAVPSIHARGRTGCWIRLQAAAGEGVEGRTGDTIIVMEPLEPREISWLRPATYGLTPREQEVVDLVIRGASTREIAAALIIAESTVQDHLKHVFEKVGVRHRRGLVQRLLSNQ